MRRSLCSRLEASAYLRLRTNAKVLCVHTLDADVGPAAIGTVLRFRKASDMHMDAELVKKVCNPAEWSFCRAQYDSKVFG